MTTLIKRGDFRSSAGLILPFKIECDALSTSDMLAFADLIAYRFRFGQVEGVPSGGVRLAKLLAAYRRKDEKRLLIVDDVLTTGRSMEQWRAGRDAVGVVLFARGECPPWVHPVFSLGEYFA